MFVVGALGKVRDLIWFEQERYRVNKARGHSRKQMERHVVRDAMHALRRDWAEQKQSMADAATAEAVVTRPGSGDRETRRALKAKLAEEKRAFYAAREQEARLERQAVQAARLQFWKRKQEVLAEARQEMIKALTEDEALWERHPREMMNRRYVTHGGRDVLSPHN